MAVCDVENEPSPNGTRFPGKRSVQTSVVLAVLVLMAMVGLSRQVEPATAANSVEPRPPGAAYTRVAFVADTSFAELGPRDLTDLDAYGDVALPMPARVMKLIRAEGADLVVHGGDIGYVEDGKAIPEKWDRMVTQILGADFPLLASGGNHDQRHWNSAPPDGELTGLGYRQVLQRRYENVKKSKSGADLTCSFPNGIDDIGQRASCNYKNVLTVITVGLGKGNGIPPTEFGQPDNEFEAYLSQALAASQTPWTVCNWHFNQARFQLGYKTNEAGWKPYEYCRRSGALIGTGHEHSYARTHLMSRFAESASTADIVSSEPDLTIDEGATIAWVSGLGGRGIRAVSNQADNPWWAAQVHLGTEGIKGSAGQPIHGGGALFCDFSVTDDSNAVCFFKTVDGERRDAFELVSNANGATGTFPSSPTLPPTTAPPTTAPPVTTTPVTTPVTTTPVTTPVTTTPVTTAPTVRATCARREATIVGTMGDDVLTGTPGDDVIAGLAGNDRIVGRGGADVICGGGGDDQIRGGRGADRLYGDSGNDTIYGGRGADVIVGSSGGDIIRGGPGRDDLSGGGGDDTLFGGPHADELRGDAGRDVCNGGSGRDTATTCESTRRIP